MFKHFFKKSNDDDIFETVDPRERGISHEWRI